MRSIKCFGGPLHGQMIHDPGSMRIDARDFRKHFRRNLFFEPGPPDDLRFDTASYEVSYWHEQCGNARRSIRIAVIDGQDNLLERERNEIRDALSEVPWEPVQPRSILHEFAGWWAWCIYKRTGNQYCLGEELIYR